MSWKASPSKFPAQLGKGRESLLKGQKEEGNAELNSAILKPVFSSAFLPFVTKWNICLQPPFELGQISFF